MKQLILLLTLIYFFGSSVYAQKKKSGSNNSPIKETKGSEFRVKKSNRSYNFLSAVKIDNEYYVIARKVLYDYASIIISYKTTKHNSDFIIYRLDSKMNFQELAVIPTEYYGKDVESYTVKKVGNKLCAFFYFNNTKQLKQYLFAQPLNAKSLDPIGEPYKVAEASILKKERNITCIFNVDVTEDHSKLFITTDRSNVQLSKREKKASAAKKNQTFTYWLISDKFELISSGKNLKIGTGNTKIIGQASDNNGNMCLLGYIVPQKTKTKGKKKKFDDDEVSEYDEARLVMKIIKSDGEQTDLEFAKGEYFYSASMKLNPNTGNVAVVALVSGGKGGAKGIFTQQVNLSTGETGDESLKLFGTELVKEINSLKPPAGDSKSKKKSNTPKNKKTRKERKSSNEPVDYIFNLVRIGDIHYTDSNELVIVTQKFYTYTVTYTTTDSKGHTTTYTVTYYVYSDIIPFKLNAFGEIESYGFVFHNSQSAGGDFYKDYSSLYANEKCYLMTTTEGGQVTLDNKASKLHAYKEYETYKKKKVFADFISVSNSEMLHIIATKKKMLFTLMSVKID